MELTMMIPKVSFKSREQRFMASLREPGTMKEVYIGSYSSIQNANEAIDKVLSGVPIKEVRTERKVSKNNISGVKNISFISNVGKWRVTAPKTSEFIAEVKDLEEAKRILKTFLETGKKPEYNHSRGVSWDEDICRWVAYSMENGRKVYLGRFENLDQAEKAVEIYENTGEKPFVKRKGRPRKVVC